MLIVKKMTITCIIGTSMISYFQISGQISLKNMEGRVKINV